MFVDVKNFAPNQVTTTVSKRKAKAKGTFRNLFKSVLRMLKADKSISLQSVGSNTHPNNVYLNNCTDLSSIIPKVTEVCTLSNTNEDYITAIRKVTKDEEILQSLFTSDFGNEHKTSALYYTFSKLQSTAECICSYGYNCQHNHTGPKKYDYSSYTPFNLASFKDISAVPVHYVGTEDGMFFWTSEQDKLDTDLMEGGHFKSRKQLPQAQWTVQLPLY